MKKKTLKKVTVLIPCYNEESGIGQVIADFPVEKMRTAGFELAITVIDNNSKDKTADVARAAGATVLHEPKKGKGNAMRLGFNSISKDTDYVVMLDGDNSYKSREILRLLELLDSDFCDVVIGSRLGGKITQHAMSAFNRLGNWGFSHLVRLLYRVNVTDVLTGYFAWKREAIEKLRPHLESEGFAIEMEMVTKMAKLDEAIYSVPITYESRHGESNLRPVYDGTRILIMLLKNLFWSPKKPGVQRVAFVSDTVLPYFNGGKEKRLYEITRRLVTEGREVHIYTMQWWKGPTTIQHEGVYFHALCKLHPLYLESGRRSIAEALWFALAVFKLFFVRFDILDVDHMPFFPLFSARIVTWMRGKKMHATWHEVWGRDYWMEYMGGPSGWFGYFIETLSFRLPDVIISNSTHTTNRLVRAGVRTKIQTVPLGADLSIIYAAQRGKTAYDVIYVGRLLGHKNVDMLIEALREVRRKLPKLTALIVGEGPEKPFIERIIREAGLEDAVQLRTHVPSHTDLYSLMKASKMLVLPSVREGFGLVVVEAHAAGIPVITTTHEDNAARDLIHEGVDGFLSEPNSADLAAKIMHTLDVYSTLEPRKFVDQYDWDVAAKSMEQSFI